MSVPLGWGHLALACVVQIYRYWLDDIKDWCISRQLWWGHRIPVYYVHADQAAADLANEGEGDGSSEVYVVRVDAVMLFETRRLRSRFPWRCAQAREERKLTNQTSGRLRMARLSAA